MGMKKDTKTRILIIKDYMEKWDWNIAPLFMLAEEDAQALLEVLSLYEKNVKRRSAKYKENRK